MKKMLALALVLLAASAPAVAQSCDWEVTKSVNMMTDVTTCNVTSRAGLVRFYRHGNDRPNVIVLSAYSRPGLTMRVDDLPAIRMGDDAGSRQRALDKLLPQLDSGLRLRVLYDDYPDMQRGEVAVCNLPELLKSCTE